MCWSLAYGHDGRDAFRVRVSDSHLLSLGFHFSLTSPDSTACIRPSRFAADETRMAEQRYTDLASQLVRAVAPELDSKSAAQYVLREIKADRKGGTRREWIDVSTSLNT